MAHEQERDDAIEQLTDDEQSELRLNKFMPACSYDTDQQEVNLTFAIKDLIAASIRKIDAETGKKKSPAVMFALPTEVQTVQYMANGNLYEVQIGLGRQNAGAYLTVRPKKIGKLAPTSAPLSTPA